MKDENMVSVTVLLPGGRLPLTIMNCANELAREFDLGIYLSTLQNLRLINVPESQEKNIKKKLAALGAEFKGPGKFPIPRICVGKPYCNLGIVDTEAMGTTILNHFAEREYTKAKLKISISACPLCCSAPKTTDIGLFATRDGYEVYAGGKGGSSPKIGIRIERKASEQRVLDIIETLVEFHDKKTKKKGRMAKLLSDSEFPFQEI